MTSCSSLVMHFGGDSELGAVSGVPSRWKRVIPVYWTCIVPNRMPWGTNHGLLQRGIRPSFGQTTISVAFFFFFCLVRSPPRPVHSLIFPTWIIQPTYGVRLCGVPQVKTPFGELFGRDHCLSCLGVHRHFSSDVKRINKTARYNVERLR